MCDNGTIKKFSEFENYLDDFKNKNSGRTLYFRGEHSDYPYSIPSIYRKYKNKENVIASASDKFYSDLSVHLGDLNLFDLSYSNQLARFQHYQAPTRLLDITTNPLIALFFALEDTGKNSKKNRTIYFYAVDKDQIKYQDGHTVNMEVTANWMNQNIVHNFIQSMKSSEKDNLIDDYKDKTENNGLYKLSNNYIYRLRSRYGNLIDNDFENHHKDIVKEVNDTSNPIDDFMKELNRKDKLADEMTLPDIIYKDLNRAYFVNFIRETDRMKTQQGAFIMPKYLTRLENIEDIKTEDNPPIELLRAIDLLPENKKRELINQHFNSRLHQSIIDATDPRNVYKNNEVHDAHPGFRRYTIPSDFVEQMRKDINALGVNAGSVYPDIEHYSQFLIDSYNER